MASLLLDSRLALLPSSTHGPLKDDDCVAGTIYAEVDPEHSHGLGVEREHMPVAKG